MNNNRVFPQQGSGLIRQRPEKVLLICYYDPSGISTVRETVTFMQACSRFAVTILNIFAHRHASGLLAVPKEFDFDDYTCVILHNTVTYTPQTLRSLDALTSRKLKDYRGVKVLMKQDENHGLHEIVDYIGKTGFDLILTVLPEAEIEKVYPTKIVGRPRFYRMLTGYVTPALRALRPSTDNRPIDIGYRGSLQPLWFGRLAYEKRKIGGDISDRLKDQNLKMDISSKWEDRFGGEAWYEFLFSIKATLGTESGASLFDLDGQLKKRIAGIEKELGPEKLDANYAEAYLSRLAVLEGNIYYNQISPRHFEAIACGAVQLLYEGTYSGLLEAGRHYFSLKKDYSNLKEAVALIQDEPRRKAMAQLAYNEVILDKKNWIETFVEHVDDLIEEIALEKGLLYKPIFTSKELAFNILQLAPQEAHRDPRHGWIAGMEMPGFKQHQVGIFSYGQNSARLMTIKNDAVDMTVPKLRWRSHVTTAWYPYLGKSKIGTAILHELSFIESVSCLNDQDFCRAFSAPNDVLNIGIWRSRLQDLLDTTLTLVQSVIGMRDIHALIACDFYTLPAALILKALLDLPVVYDAHEYMPEMILKAPEFEKQFWLQLENRLVQYTDYRQTVSPALAQIMTDEYGCKFETVANCEPRSRAFDPNKKEKRSDNVCIFLFIGSFSDGRGIDLLINVWAQTNPRALLHLQGLSSEYKTRMIDLAEKTGLLNKRIFFPEPVTEDLLIETATRADVGLIPYEPIGINHQYCCPNKMSQYMAAGIPILANATSFVAETITAAHAGLVINFRQSTRLIEAIDRLTTDVALRDQFASAGNAYFRSTYNWDVQSSILRENLASLVRHKSPGPLILYDNALPLPQIKKIQLIRFDKNFFIRSFRAAWRHLPLGLKDVIRPYARKIILKVRIFG